MPPTTVLAPTDGSIHARKRPDRRRTAAGASPASFPTLVSETAVQLKAQLHGTTPTAVESVAAAQALRAHGSVAAGLGADATRTP